MPTPPRIPPETRQEAISRLEMLRDWRGASAKKIVDTVAAVLFAKLLGDARDRVATLISAADAYLYVTEDGLGKRPAEDIAAKRRGLRRALAMLEAEDE